MAVHGFPCRKRKIKSSLSREETLSVHGILPGISPPPDWMTRRTFKRTHSASGGLLSQERQTMRTLLDTVSVFENGPYNREHFKTLRKSSLSNEKVLLLKHENTESQINKCVLHGRQRESLCARKRAETLKLAKLLGDRLEKQVRTQRYANAHLQAPVATVTLRWRVKINDPGYTSNDVRDWMILFGPIRKITMTSENTAFVIFENLKDACEAVATCHIGREENMIMCLWYHTFMKNKTYQCREQVNRQARLICK